MIVLKFGGTSLQTPDHIRNVLDIVTRAGRDRDRTVTVCSAFGGATEDLIRMSALAAARDRRYQALLSALVVRHRDAVEDLLETTVTEALTQVNRLLNDLEDVLQGVFLIREASDRSRDYIMSFGERLAARIVAHALEERGADACFCDARPLIRTDDAFGLARVDMLATRTNIQLFMAAAPPFVVTTGFIGSNGAGLTTTLGRGGSDYTASLFGAALQCEEIQIWTDVSGVLTADPRRVPKATTVPHLSYEEAMELSHFGAKVIYPPTMAPAMAAAVPMRIKNTLDPSHPGTSINAVPRRDVCPVRGISSIDEVALLQLKGSGLIGVAGISNRLFGALAAVGVNVILISQGSSEHNICFAIAPDEAEKARHATEQAFAYEILTGMVEKVQVRERMSIVAVVGANMASRPGVAGRVFQALGRGHINVAAIAQGSSESNISFVIEQNEVTNALNVLHEAFFAKHIVTHVFLVGVGLIGKTLLQQIERRRDHLAAEGLDLCIVGVANTSKMVFDVNGLDPGRAQASLAASRLAMDISTFIVKAKGMTNCVLVDCTAGHEIPAFYAQVLEAGISVVTPNKFANTDSYDHYLELRRLAARPRVNFFYEANVGAGLPVIRTICDMIASGDRITAIEAILSGTLSYLFNTFSAETPFSAALRSARDMGFTEPDPREDLSGADVARKLLILARECGYPLEMKDIEVENLVPACCAEAASAEEFMTRLADADRLFEERRLAARGLGKVLRYIATLEHGRARVAVCEVGPDHPCYRVSDCDNLISIRSQRYREAPLVIQGPGAGAEVTAAQVFAEIIRAAHRSRLTGIDHYP